MALARDLSGVLGGEDILANEGAFLLGAATPDIRVLLRCPREQTHFFSLATDDPQDSLARLCAEHPRLADPARLSPQGRAFMAGYLSHLAADETWIEDYFRPCFREESDAPEELRGDVLDRVLQFELDRRRREDEDLRAHVREALARVAVPEEICFLERPVLERWVAVSSDQALHAPDWNRFVYQGGRHLQRPELQTEEGMAAFLEQVPRFLGAAVERVTPERVDAYEQTARERSVRVIERYLTCA